MSKATRIKHGAGAQLALVLVPGTELDPALLPDVPRTRLELVPHGHPTEAAALALLGQDPAHAWSGPAAFAAATSGRALGAHETAWLLDPVRASSDGLAVLEGPVRLPPAVLADVLEHLAHDLGARAELVPGEPTVLVVGEPLRGPATAVAELLPGRALDTFHDGAAILADVVRASRGACLEAGAAATHLVPHSPAGALQVRLLAQVWPHVRSAAVVGSTGAAGAVAMLTGATLVMVPAGRELLAAAHELSRRDVVAVLPGAPPSPEDLELLDAATILVVASEPDAEGTLDLAVLGAPPPTETRDPLGRYVEPR